MLAQLTPVLHGKVRQHVDKRQMSHPFRQQAAPRSIKAYHIMALRKPFVVCVNLIVFIRALRIKRII